MQGSLLDLSSEAAALTRGAEAAVEEQRQSVAALEAGAAEIDGVTKLLREVPKRLTHRVMVPFGEAAFFPGRLVRTNECMLQLGQGHMVECTSHQAAEILARRKARLQAQLTATAAELRAAEGRLAEAAGQLQADSQEGVREILEAYDPAVHGPLAAERPAAGSCSAASRAPSAAAEAGRQAPGGGSSEEELFRRMAALEAEEAAAEAAGAGAEASATPALASSPGQSASGAAGTPKPLARGFFDRPKQPPKPPKPASGAPATQASSSGRPQVLQGVVERQPAVPQQLPAQPPAAAQARAEAPKKVSRFKQQRMAGAG